jgi:hypothetical protein
LAIQTFTPTYRFVAKKDDRTFACNLVQKRLSTVKALPVGHRINAKEALEAGEQLLLTTRDRPQRLLNPTKAFATHATIVCQTPTAA